MNTSRTPFSTTPATGTWFSRNSDAYDLTNGLSYQEALTVATAWAEAGLSEDSVEIDVEVFAQGDEWVVDVVAFERAERIGARQARIDSHGRLVA